MAERLLLGERSVAQWRVAARTTHQARFDRVLDQARSYFDWSPPRDHPSETITYIGMAVANLALADLIAGEDEPGHLAVARRWIDTAVHYPHWGRAHLPDHDLDAGWLCFGLGLGYDWLGERLPADERRALHAKLVLQGSRLHDFAIERTGQWWSSAWWQNHNWICWAGLATAAFALQRAGERTGAQAWATDALDNFRTVLAMLPEDGSDYEGPVYWNYGVPWLLIACDLLEQEAGVDLHQAEFLRNTFDYRLSSSAPNLIDTANFGDCHDRRSAHSAATCYRIASQHRNGHAQWLADHFETTGEWAREGRDGLLRPGLPPQAFLEFLWYDQTVAPAPLQELPLTRVFPDLGLVSARTSWNPDATYVAFKCGAPSGHKAWATGHAINRDRAWQTLKPGHAHPDENSFILIRGNDYLTVDEGYSQAKQSHHHSTVLVDEQGQYREGAYDSFADLGPDQCGRLECSFSGAGIVYARGEAAGAYDPALGLQRFRRQLVLAGDRHVVIHDELRSSMPRAFTWLLQTDVPAHEIEPARHTLETGASRLDIQVLEPNAFTVETRANEIVAYPSSSTPEWVLRHTQYALAIQPSERREAVRFLVVLGFGEAGIDIRPSRTIPCIRGDAVELPATTGRRVAAFASSKRFGIEIAGVAAANARWITLDLDDNDAWTRFAASDTTRVEIDERLRFTASEPVQVARDGPGDLWTVRTTGPCWVSLASAHAPATVRVNGQPLPATFDPLTSMTRLHVPAGDLTVHLEGEATA